MPKGEKQVVLEKDVYLKLKELKEVNGVQIQWKVNNVLRKELGLIE